MRKVREGEGEQQETHSQDKVSGKEANMEQELRVQGLPLFPIDCLGLFCSV